MQAVEKKWMHQQLYCLTREKKGGVLPLRLKFCCTVMMVFLPPLFFLWLVMECEDGECTHTDTWRLIIGHTGLFVRPLHVMLKKNILVISHNENKIISTWIIDRISGYIYIYVKGKHFYILNHPQYWVNFYKRVLCQDPLLKGRLRF